MRTDELPVEDESHWNMVYQPNGDREEVRQQMYLRFRGGLVYGLGYETIRKLCKISGKYKLNERSNQTTIAFNCRFSNELDTVMFHGCGNGTGFVGNCYIHEIDRFSMFSEVPGIRSIGGDKSKGSFLLLKMDSMGDPQLRVRLHSRRVHKWAGNLFPDDSASMPMSPLRSPGAKSGKSGEVYTSVNSMDSTAGSTTSGRSSTFRLRTSKRGGSGTGGGKRQKLLGLLTFGKRRRRFVEPLTPTSPVDRAAVHGKLPPWVQRGALDQDEDDDVDNFTVTPSTLGRSSRSPAAGDGSRRSSGLPSIETMNYLNVDGVPGRSGPAMV
ncbi:unnamed protein product [Laminaria digitata]